MVTLTKQDLVETKQDLLNTIHTTNKQMLDAVTDIVQQTEKRLTDKLASKDDLYRVETNLGRKIKNSHTANVRHHLETRKDIGDLNSQYANLRDFIG